MVCQKDWDTGKLNSEHTLWCLFPLTWPENWKICCDHSWKIGISLSHINSFTYQIIHSAIWQLQILGRFYTDNFYPSENPNLYMLFMYCSPECTIALLTLNSESPLFVSSSNPRTFFSGFLVLVSILTEKKLLFVKQY